MFDGTPNIKTTEALATLLLVSIFYLLVVHAWRKGKEGYQALIRFWVSDPSASNMSFAQLLNAFIADEIFRDNINPDYLLAKKLIGRALTIFIISLIYISLCRNGLSEWLEAVISILLEAL